MGTISCVFAQSQKTEEAKDVILGRKKSGSTNQNPRDIILNGGNENGPIYGPNNHPDNYPYGSRQQRIEQINRQYDAKIQSIRNNPYLSTEEKRRIIRELNAERARKIRAINNDHNRDYDDDDDDDKYKKDKKYKSNNGNHYGWEKGKGNPHKDGGKKKSKNYDD